MATTAGTTFPMVPAALGGHGSKGTAITSIMELPASASMAYRQGDIVVYDQTNDDGVEVNNAPADFVLGIVHGAKLSETTSAASGSVVPIALALPGALFEGTIIVSGPGDATGARAADINVGGAIGVAFDPLESTQGYCCIANNVTANDMIFTLNYAMKQPNDKTKSGHNSGVGVTNPRVIFWFGNTVFSLTSAVIP